MIFPKKRMSLSLQLIISTKQARKMQTVLLMLAFQKVKANNMLLFLNRIFTRYIENIVNTSGNLGTQKNKEKEGS